MLRNRISHTADPVTGAELFKVEIERYKSFTEVYLDTDDLNLIYGEFEVKRQSAKAVLDLLNPILRLKNRTNHGINLPGLKEEELDLRKIVKEIRKKNWRGGQQGSSDSPGQVQVQPEYGSQSQSAYGNQSQSHSGYGYEATSPYGHQPQLQPMSVTQDPSQVMPPPERRETLGLLPDMRLDYTLSPNQYHGVTITISQGTHYEDSFNTNEQRVVHNHMTSRNTPKWISDELYRLRRAAGRHPFRVPQNTIIYLENVICFHMLHCTADTCDHWCRVNLDYGEGDRARVDDQDVPKLPASIFAFHEERRRTEAAEERRRTEAAQSSTFQASAPPPATRQYSPPRSYQGPDPRKRSPTDDLFQPRSTRLPKRGGSGSRTS